MEFELREIELIPAFAPAVPSGIIFRGQRHQTFGEIKQSLVRQLSIPEQSNVQLVHQGRLLVDKEKLEILDSELAFSPIRLPSPASPGPCPSLPRYRLYFSVKHHLCEKHRHQATSSLRSKNSFSNSVPENRAPQTQVQFGHSHHRPTQSNSTSNAPCNHQAPVEVSEVQQNAQDQGVQRPIPFNEFPDHQARPPQIRRRVIHFQIKLSDVFKILIFIFIFYSGKLHCFAHLFGLGF